MMKGVAGRWWSEVVSCIGPIPGDRTGRQVALLLGTTAVVLVGLHLYTVLSLRDGGIADWTIDPTWLRLDRDRSISEFFEYVATLAAALLILRAWWSTRQPIYLAVAVVFLVMAFDNALMLHEWTAITLVDRGWLATPFGKAPAHARGELVFHAVAGGGLVVLAAIAFHRSGFRHRVRGLILLAPVGLAMGFGIGVDYVQALSGGRSWLRYALSVVEDGGELLAIVLLLLLSIGIVRQLPVASEQHCSAAALHSPRPRKDVIRQNRLLMQ